ncbi:outer membrane beta-barrel protein [Sphingobium sp. JS3065]|uniref:outer membrane beta-barrel protein n=1 Tax=Sphingobium sp. JS3065 TaxID=2970925 RepID=UPI002264937F|nr:outer membrane beta-barrel protein [Sphingobium sp. JS3065]UZW54538.1 outer membrane beta-barrel protein [Sphingobium sp. JS3065]
MRGLASGGAAAILLLAAADAHAQDLDSTDPMQGAPAALFEPTPLTLGSATVRIGGSARLEYDSNIYAQAFGEKDDFRLQFRPYVDLLRKGSALELTARAEGDFRRYFQYDKENAEGGRVSAGLNWNPSAADRLNVAASWQHLIEDRGEPEGNTLPSIGPRELNMVDGDLSYLHQGSRIGFLFKATGARMRYTRVIDEERDLDAVGGLARVMMRVSPLASLFVEGVAAHRNFRLAPTPGQFNRDASTYGGRIGIAIDPGGTLRGDAAVGVYRLDAKDKLIESQTRMSVQIGLAYAPRPRTTITLDGFIGNVATYRTGVQSREDMRFRLGINQEIRHNLNGRLGILYRRSKYFGTDDTDNLYGLTGELEYAVNRRVAIAATARFSKRDSSVALDEFDRIRGGLELRIHY